MFISFIMIIPPQLFDILYLFSDLLDLSLDIDNAARYLDILSL